MSTRSTPSACVSDDASPIGKNAVTAMLDRYAAEPPTVTEMLAQPSKKNANVVKNSRSTAENYLSKWQALWEKMD